MEYRYNLYSRSEEEKTRDMVIYETKAKAKDICHAFERIKKKANLVTLVAAVVLAIAGIPFFLKAYYGESLLGMGAVFLFVILLSIAARLAAGSILSRSLKVFTEWARLSRKWTAARDEMHELEAKFADQTVFEDDMKKAEKKLMDASEALITFKDKYNIKTEE